MTRVRPPIVALLLGVTLTVLAAAGPAAARPSDETPPASPGPTVEDATARAFVDATRQFVQAAGPQIDEAVGRENDAIGLCQRIVDGAPARVQPQLSDLIANDLATVTWRAMVGPYAQLVTQLTDAAPSDPILRGAVDAAWTLKELQLPLVSTRIATCRLVRQWKATRWARSFPARHPRAFASSLVAPDKQARALQAQTAIQAAGARLEELGVSPGDAMLFSAAVGSSLI
jgi:hypothetical protein